MTMNTPGSNASLSQITELWRQVLPATSLEPDTHFFLAGGDSLQLGSLLLRVREQLGVELRLQDLQHFSTPRKMAQCCAMSAVPSNRLQAPTGPHIAPSEYAASSTQQGLWWSEQQAAEAELPHSSTGLYNSGVVIGLHGALQWPLLAAAIAALVTRFPLLASCLQFDVRQRRLMVRPAVSKPELEPPTTVAVEAVDAVAAGWVAEPFDLARSLFRCKVLRHSDHHHSLLLCGHHCVLDGWSGAVLLQQLAAHYRELKRDRHWQPPATDEAFAEHCRRQQQRFASNEHRRQLDWWRAFMNPLAQQRPALPWQPLAQHWPYRVQQLGCELPAELLQRLQRLCASRDCTLFAVLASALLVALRSVGATDPVIGFPLAGRTTAQEEASVGCYMQLVPLKLDLDAVQPLEDQLSDVHAAVQQVLAHAVPLPALVSGLRPRPLADGNAWFDIVLALQNFPQPECDWSPLTAHWRALPALHAQYLLKLEVAGSMMTAEYAAAVIPVGDVKQLLANMQQVLLQLSTFYDC